MDNQADLPVGEGTTTHDWVECLNVSTEFKSDREALEVFRKTSFLHIGVKDSASKA